MPPITPSIAACLTVLVLASIWDIFSKKIPNFVTFPAALVGIIMQYMETGTSGAISGIEGWFVGVLTLILVKACLRQIGYGDVKLVAAVGAFLGPRLVLLVCFYFSLCFAVYVLFLIARVLPWQQIFIAMINRTSLPEIMNSPKVQEVRKSLVPLAPLITAGTICAILLGKPTLQLLGFTT